MIVEELIKNLEYTEKKHKNDIVNTFDTNISVMCKDIPEYLEQEPCEDAISRQAVLEAIDVKAWEFCDYLISKNRNDEQKPVSHFADNLRECVREELPSVNPQERTGYWIRFKEFENGYYHIKCSECGQYWSIDGHAKIFNYCFNCGAKMEVEQNG